MRRTIVCRLGVVALAVCTLALPATEAAEAASKWGSPMRLSSIGEGGENSRLAVNERGDAVVLWTVGYLIQGALRRAPGDAWRALTSALSSFQQVTEPQVAIDGRGRAVAVWVQGSRVCVAVAPHRTWSAPTAVSRSGMTVQSPQIAVDAQGDAAAIWEQRKEFAGEPMIEAAIRPAKQSAWSAPVDVAAMAESPQIAVNAHGDMVMGWETYTGRETPSLIQASVGSVHGKWQKPVTVGLAGRFGGGQPKVGIDARGDAVLVWEQRHDNGGVDIWAASRQPGKGAWRPPAEVASLSGYGVRDQLAVNTRGRVVVVWENATTTESGVEAAFGSLPDGTWQSPERLATWTLPPTPACPVSRGRVCPVQRRPPPSADPHVALDLRGDAVAVWKRAEDQSTVQSAYRPRRSRTWQAPTTLHTGLSATPDIAMDQQGAIAVWSGAVVEADLLKPVVK
jgi:hypothetical protein